MNNAEKEIEKIDQELCAVLDKHGCTGIMQFSKGDRQGISLHHTNKAEIAEFVWRLMEDEKTSGGVMMAISRKIVGDVPEESPISSGISKSLDELLAAIAKI